MSPPSLQDSLPAGWLSLYREGVEPSGSLQKVSDHPSSFSGLSLAQGKFHFGTSLHIIRSRHRRVAVERRIHCDLGAIIAGAVQSFGRISTTNTRSGTFVLFCAVCARFPVSK